MKNTFDEVFGESTKIIAWSFGKKYNFNKKIFLSFELNYCLFQEAYS